MAADSTSAKNNIIYVRVFVLLTLEIHIASIVFETKIPSQTQTQSHASHTANHAQIAINGSTKFVAFIIENETISP